MFRIRYLALLALTLLLALTSCENSTTAQQGASTPSSTPTQAASPAQQETATSPSQNVRLQHIFYIVMENHSTSSILGNTADAPYLNSMANSYGVATQYFGVTHPSLPNYLAAISGSFQGIWDDCSAGASVTCSPQVFGSSLTGEEATNAANQPHMFNGQTLVDQLEAHHLSWKAYMQSMPSAGYTGGSTALYAQKHNPFVYFSDIHNNPAHLERIVPLTQFNQDITSRNVPNFVWITPDVCNDMHGVSSASAQALGIADCATYDGIIALGDKFISTLVPQIMGSSAWKQGSAIVIVWDEGNGADSSGCCKSPTGGNGTMLGGGNTPIIVITSHGPHHIVLSNNPYNHYSLLATIENIWGLGCLANTCGMIGSDLMTNLFE